MDSPVIRLTYAILLGVVKRVPDAFRIRPDGETLVVEYAIGDEIIEELRGPVDILGAVIRRMSVMANLPMYGKGEVAIGRIQIVVGDANHYFAIQVRGHGSELGMSGNLLTEAELHN